MSYVVGSGRARSRRASPARLRWRVIAGWISLCLALYLGGFAWFFARIDQPITEPTRPTDGIVVLTGGGTRIAVAMRLLEQGLSPRLFISGVNRKVDMAKLTESQLRPDGIEVTPCCVTLGHRAEDTLGNAAESMVWMRENGVRTVRLVTANYHMPRALIEFRRLAPEIEVVPHPVFPGRFTDPDWWLDPGTDALVLGEYNKLLIAALRDQLAVFLTEEAER